MIKKSKWETSFSNTLILFAIIIGAIKEFIKFLIKCILLEPIEIFYKLFLGFTIFICKIFWTLAIASFAFLETVVIETYKYIKNKYEMKKLSE